MSYLGNTYDIRDLLGTGIVDGEERNLRGRYSVEEYEPYEPSAYSWSETFIIVKDGAPQDDWEQYAYRVDAFDLICQIDPETAARQMDQEVDLARFEEADRRMGDWSA